MNKFTKSLLTGVVALGLLAPVATSSINNNPEISVHARSRALSYYRAKRDVRKAYNGKDKLHDHFDLRNNGHRGNRTYLKAPFGANSNIYFTVTHYGRYAYIHVTLRGTYGDARKPGLHNFPSSEYRFYGIRRNKTVRAY